MVMKRPSLKVVIIFLFILFLTGCVKLALKFSASLIPRMSQTFFEECDLDLAKQSLPANLKLMEGLLKNDPKNKQLLMALSMGFTGYAMLFVEEEDPGAASLLYLRARDYGLRALDRKAPLSKDSSIKKEITQSELTTIGEEKLEALFWTSMSWNAWINLNLDKPIALAQLGIAQACLERVLEIKPDYFYGAPYILMGSTLAAVPGPLGGDETMAKEYFEKAMQVSHGRFLLAHYFFARYYAVRVQDKELFLKLIEEVDYTSSDELKEVCLINAAIKKRIRRLMEISEELFL